MGVGMAGWWYPPRQGARARRLRCAQCPSGLGPSRDRDAMGEAVDSRRAGRSGGPTTRRAWRRPARRLGSGRRRRPGLGQSAVPLASNRSRPAILQRIAAVATESWRCPAQPFTVRARYQLNPWSMPGLPSPDLALLVAEQRQIGREGRTSPRAGSHLDVSPVGMDDPLADRQPKAGAAFASRPGLVYLVKALKEMGQVLSGDADVSVSHRGGRSASLALHGDGDASTWTSLSSAIASPSSPA